MRYLWDCCQLQACQRKLDSKCEALLILSKDLDQCRQERDQFQLMAEQVQSRYQSIKRQLAGIVSPELFSIRIDSIRPLLHWKIYFEIYVN